MKTRLTLDEMNRLVSSNGTGWVWVDRQKGIGRITTSEGEWAWSDAEDCYLLVRSAKS